MVNYEKTISHPGSLHPFVERALNTLGYLILRQAYVSAAGGESPCKKEEGYTCTALDIYENFCGELSTYIYELNALIKEGNGPVYEAFRNKVLDELIEGIYLGFDSDVYKDLGLTKEERPGHYSKHLKDILTHYGATQETIEFFEGCVSEALEKHQKSQEA